MFIKNYKHFVYKFYYKLDLAVHMFLKIGVPENLTKFSGKHPAAYIFSRNTFDQGFALGLREIFKKTLVFRTAVLQVRCYLSSIGITSTKSANVNSIE